MIQQLNHPLGQTTVMTRVSIPAKSPRTTDTWPVQRDMRSRPRPRLRFAFLGAVLLIVGSAVLFRWQSSSRSAEVLTPAQPSSPLVNVTAPARGEGGELSLPATIQAYQATDLFARANGFLKAWYFEIGAPVKAGQVLAKIETPELDQELAQAVAFLRQGEAEHQQAIAELEEAKADVALANANVVKARANVDFAISQSDRYRKLVAGQTVAREEYENAVRDQDARKAECEAARADLTRRQANLGTRQAIIESREAVVGNRQANVQRLRDLTGFQNVVAPFDGIVTRRNAEVGMLVTAGSNTGTRPLYSVAQIDVLRVQALVPQSSAFGIKAGDAAVVSIPEKPGQALAAKVTRTSGAVEPSSRSLLVEVELPNADGLIPPGVYAQIHFQTAQAQASWVIPVNTLLLRSAGPHVVTVATDGTVRSQKVTLGRDFGSKVEVLVGLTGDERLVVNPTDSLRDGLAVQVETPIAQAKRREAP